MFSYLKSVLFGEEVQQLIKPSNTGHGFSSSVDNKLQLSNSLKNQSLNNKNLNQSKILHSTSDFNHNSNGGNLRQRNQLSQDARFSLPKESHNERRESGKILQLNNQKPNNRQELQQTQCSNKNGLVQTQAIVVGGGVVVNPPSKFNNLSGISINQSIPLLNHNKRYSTKNSHPQKLNYSKQKTNRIQTPQDLEFNEESKIQTSVLNQQHQIEQLSDELSIDQQDKDNQLIINYDSNSKKSINQSLLLNIFPNQSKSTPNNQKVKKAFEINSNSKNNQIQFTTSNNQERKLSLTAGQNYSSQFSMKHQHQFGHQKEQSSNTINLQPTFHKESHNKQINQLQANQKRNQSLQNNLLIISHPQVQQTPQQKQNFKREIQPKTDESFDGDKTLKFMSLSVAGKKAQFRYVENDSISQDMQTQRIQNIESTENKCKQMTHQENKSSIQDDGSTTIRNQMSVDFRSQKAMVFKNMKFSGSKDKPPTGLHKTVGHASRNTYMLNFGSSIQQQSDVNLIEEVIPVIQTPDDEIQIQEYRQIRAAVEVNGPEAPTVPQSAYVSILGSGFSNAKDKSRVETSNKNSFIVVSMNHLNNTQKFVNIYNNNNNPQSQITNQLDLLIDHQSQQQVTVNNALDTRNSRHYEVHNEYFNNLATTQKLPLLEPYLSKEGDQIVASRQAFEDDDYNQYDSTPNNNNNMRNSNGGCEDRKETEQLPFTKDMIAMHEAPIDHIIGNQDYQQDDDGDSDEEQQNIIDSNDNLSDTHKNHRTIIALNGNIRYRNAQQQNLYDSSEDINGVDIEFNEMERTVAQKSIRRSVVKDKLNWSCQFGHGYLTKNTKTLDGIQKLFMDSRGAQQAVNALKNQNSKRQYHISQNALLFELSMPNKDLKFISVNMLCKNLKIIDLQNNKLQTLPEEISDLVFLEKFRVDNNNLKFLPQNLCNLSMLQTLSICYNQISDLPEGLEKLTKLEILLLHDNRISKLTPRIGNLSLLKKLLVHNNLLQELPIEIYKLTKLKEFSTEWFMYLKPPMPRIQRDQQGEIMIEKFKQFCRSKTLYPASSQTSVNQPDSLSQISQKSFADYILYNFNIKPQEINNLHYGQKQRGLIHLICQNQHPHLLENIIGVGQHSFSGMAVENRQTSKASYLVQKYVDLNMKDKEGCTAICIALRQGIDEILNIFMVQPTTRLDFNINTLKYGAPLHMCILKHKFDLAIKLLDEKGVNPHTLNPNGSNALHVLFANYMYDEQNAEQLAEKLIKKSINLNLVDTNGLTPIHVAIKKDQLKALQFALNYNQISSLNTQNQEQLVQQVLQINQYKQDKQQVFDFNVRGKKKQTPLHYTISKANFEAFLFLLKENLCDIWAFDDQYRTPRGVSLINSAFYKILFKMETYFQNKKALQVFNELGVKYDQVKSSQIINNQINTNQQLKQSQRKGSLNAMITNHKKSHHQVRQQHQSVDFQKRSITDLVKYPPENLPIINNSRQQQKKSQTFQHLNLTKRYLKNTNLSSYDDLQQASLNSERDQQKKMLFLRKKHLNTEMGSSSYINNQQPTQRIILKKPDQILSKPNLQKIDSKNNLFNYEEPKKQIIGLKNISHHQNMLGNEYNSLAYQQQIHQANIINNIFISNLNINVNLNINISIPPSPLSTKGNGSRLESLPSNEEYKELSGIQNSSNKRNRARKQKQSNAFRNNLSPAMKANLYPHDEAPNHNASVRFEDLSVIDDEMPIQNKVINKNLKADQIQGIIQQIQPEIYKGLTQSLTKQNGSGSPQSLNQKNNIFINTCQIGNPLQTQRVVSSQLDINENYNDLNKKEASNEKNEEDIESSIIHQTPQDKKLNYTKKLSQNQFKNNLQIIGETNKHEIENMKRNFSSIMQEEPISNCHINNQIVQEPSHRKNQINSSITNNKLQGIEGSAQNTLDAQNFMERTLQDKAFNSYLSNTNKFNSNSTVKVGMLSPADREMQNNQFFKQYLILSSEKEQMALKYKTLYQTMALCQKSMDEKTINDILEVIVRLARQLSNKSPIQNELIYLLSQLALFHDQAHQKLIEITQILTQKKKSNQQQENKVKKFNDLQEKYEVVNGFIINHNNKRNQPKYPQISTKLNQYLQENKKRIPSNNSRIDNQVPVYQQTCTIQQPGQLRILDQSDFLSLPNAHSQLKATNNQSQNNSHQRQMTQDNKPLKKIYDTQVQKKMSSNNHNSNHIQNHSSNNQISQNNVQIIDEAAALTERVLGGTLKVNQMKIISGQQNTILSPSFKERSLVSKTNNFASVRNSQQAEQKVARNNII